MLAAQPFTDEHCTEVLELFADPDFHYRGEAHPEFLAEAEVLALLDKDTFVLLRQDSMIGLYAAEPVGGEHAGHWELHLRLRSDADQLLWLTAYKQAIEALRYRTGIVRITVRVGEYDTTGRRAALEAGMQPEGTLTEVVRHDGEHVGICHFSLIWPPEEAS